MNAHRIFLTLLLAGTAAGMAFSQGPRPAPLPTMGAAPLIYLRLIGPPGMHATFYQGSPAGRNLEMPAKVGVRPGYVYRIKLSELPGHPTLAFYPTLEVRGTLQLHPSLKAADYPAPITFSEEDIEHVAAGAVITRVIYLEDPDKAYPAGFSRDQPLKITVPPTTDPLAEARSRGRPLLVVRFGERVFSDGDLARDSIPGTILLPGDKFLPPATCRPELPLAGPQFYDPLWGPRQTGEECLHDGGDAGSPIGLDNGGHLLGVAPSGTAAAYSDSSGRRHLTVSNRICLCVPRYAVIRTESVLSAYNTSVGVADARGTESQSSLKGRVPSILAQQNERLEGLKGRERLSGINSRQALDRVVRVEELKASHIDVGLGLTLGTTAVDRLNADLRLRLARQVELARLFDQPYSGPQGIDQVQGGPGVVSRVQGLDAVTNVQVTRDLTVTCNEAPLPPDLPLTLFKWADRQSAQVGDVVTFFLKYSNQGGRPIKEVVVSDSLTGRLEYVPGSARADRDADFTTRPNEAGSALLNWEIKGSLLPGQSGVVSFQAKIR